MANESGFSIGAQWCFRNSGDFAPTTANDLRINGGTVNNVEMDLGSIIFDGSAHQSAKTGDLSVAGRLPAAFQVSACLEFGAAAPTDGKTVEFFWSGSNSATAGNDNLGFATGVDGPYTITSEEQNQLIRIGSLVVNDRTGSSPYLARGNVGMFIPRYKYGSLIVINRSGSIIIASGTQHHVVFTQLDI